jgi:hypothetical protein
VKGQNGHYYSSRKNTCPFCGGARIEQSQSDNPQIKNDPVIKNDPQDGRHGNGQAPASKRCPMGHVYFSRGETSCPQCAIVPPVPPRRRWPMVALLLSCGLAGVAAGAGWYFRSELLEFSRRGSHDGAVKSGPAIVHQPVEAKPAINRFTADPETIEAGQSSQLMIGVSDSSTITIDQGVGAVVNKDRVEVHPTVTTAYTLTVSGRGGSATRTAVVTVRQPSAVAPAIESFKADPPVTTPGQPVTLTWLARDATEFSIDRNVGVVTGGKVEVQPTVATVYTLTAKGPGGSATRQVTVQVQAPPPPRPAVPHIDSFGSNPQVIERGQDTLLSWSVSNAVRVTIDQGVGDFTPVNQASVHPRSTTTYTLTAHGSGGESIANTEVRVNVAPPPPVPQLQPQPPPPTRQPLSGVFTCPNRPIRQGEVIRIENLPAARHFHFDFDPDSWSTLPLETAFDGTRILKIVSKKPGIQSYCEVRWVTVD